MFGDAGHGTFMLAVAVFLVINEKKWMGKKVNDIFAILFNGRYVLLLFSMFAIYCGAIYNEFFAVSLDVWGTRWNRTHEDNKMFNYLGDKYKFPYPFGVDPVWKGAENELLYYNSLKMKMSVILGVIQMALGIFLKLANGIFFRHHLDIWFEFLPQQIFLLSTFGYLCFLIFAKWTLAVNNSPLILLVLINMFIPTGKASNETLRYVYTDELEAQVETALVIIAFVCIPWMLVPKPAILYCMWKKRHNRKILGYDDDESFEGHTLAEFKMSEVLVHQVLETIEFVLGTLSHTASYLRLWALSLAHSELSTVFWDMLFSTAMTFGVKLIKPPSYALVGVGAFIGFAVWFAVTAGVILIMESLSAFLHALRLHWVEFQSKFYKGDGIKFLPLNFYKVVSTSKEEVEE